MRAENAIEVRDVQKSFKVFVDRGATIKERALFSRRRKYDYRQVLRGISFEVKKGEAIGLVGHNGCGKSTTLKLLTKIIYPDRGSIEMCGRVSSLIELGAGFHPDLSGRENIYINASIFGLKRKEIDRRLDDIIAFSELEEFIDNPIRTYSSGMYMRLAFSVAINVDADILLIDEILAVGDANFQAKCFNKLREIKAQGTTIVIVSHSLGQIEQICERSIWIHEGIIREEGIPKEVHAMYLDYMGQKRQELAEKEQERVASRREEEKDRQKKEESDEAAENKVSQDADALSKPETEQSTPKRWGNKKARIKNVELRNKDGIRKNVFEVGEDITICFEYTVRETVEDAVVGIGIFRNDGLHCYGTNTHIDKLEQFSLTESGAVRVRLEDVTLMPGVYLLDLALETEDGMPVDYYREACTFEMYSKVADVGVARLNHIWDIE